MPKQINPDSAIAPFVNSSGDATWAGLTYREHFAGLALQGLLASKSPGLQTDKAKAGEPVSASLMARVAIECADELINELNKKEKTL